MSKKKKIKDTALGKWMLSKAPNVLGVVGDLLPDAGALGIVKNLLHNSLGRQQRSRRHGGCGGWRERYWALEGRHGQ